ncbi:flagellar basal-body MS-ring/collar protein FliF [Salipiger sp. PrR003]|uniref:flagellar basal-body MS-ring/collar protein FliF n=1 Tax=Salipiger sp. PrR003 TaxID=2706776 RepID=UPI0013D9BDFC|nr:flagellar basal-body MS-ring/collar protein FliF [Salipiger sp. PrR003]NDV50798.1 flagellar M-ring protein FliF [Salipiger sp. PrR003]
MKTVYPWRHEQNLLTPGGILNAILSNLRGLGPARLAVLGGVGLVLALALFFGVKQVTKPVYSTLYSGLSPSSASEIVSALEGAGIPVQVSPDSAVVSIPKSSFASARMLLAEAGLPNEGAPGWELFDGGSSMGMNSFLQRVNRLRAMEGELARSIQTIAGVDAARVHLVLPEREAFSRERSTPKASVVIRTTGSYSMDEEQANAIRFLVSSGVADLDPEHVTVMTADGKMILAENGDEGSTEATIQSARTLHEDRFERDIERILSARVGAGNVRVNVAVDVVTQRRVVVSESFNPDEQVVRSTETRNSNEESTSREGNNVSVDNNIPENLMGDTGQAAGTRSAAQDNSEIVNYEIGNTRTETVYEPGDIRKISVAVLVNGIYDRDDNGDVTYVERNAEELQRLEELVRTAVGFDVARGDTISVDSLRFIDYSMDVGEPVSSSVMDTLKENIMTILKWVFVVVVVAMILLLGVKPMLARAFPQPATGTSEDGEGEADDAQSENGAIADGENTGAPSAAVQTKSDALVAAEKAARDGDDFIDVVSVKGGVRKKRIKDLQDMVSGDREEALKILRGWVLKDG